MLIAENEMFQRLALIDYMDLCEHETISEENGSLALEELRKPENDFYLVLLDLQTPQMNGFELLTLMQEDEKLRLIPVVVMSANKSQSTVSQCLCKYLDVTNFRQKWAPQNIW